MAIKRGSYRPLPLPSSNTLDPTPEQVRETAETLATLQASGLGFFEAWRELPNTTEAQ